MNYTLRFAIHTVSIMMTAAVTVVVIEAMMPDKADASSAERLEDAFYTEHQLKTEQYWNHQAEMRHFCELEPSVVKCDTAKKLMANTKEEIRVLNQVLTRYNNTKGRRNMYAPSYHLSK